MPYRTLKRWGLATSTGELKRDVCWTVPEKASGCDWTGPLYTTKHHSLSGYDKVWWPLCCSISDAPHTPQQWAVTWFLQDQPTATDSWLVRRQWFTSMHNVPSNETGTDINIEHAGITKKTLLVCISLLYWTRGLRRNDSVLQNANETTRYCVSLHAELSESEYYRLSP